ncbi:MAG: glycoside hydrolase family 1 protein [Proteobacteria bacterium]|nr:glycoside hydrolase family 1 protein [Pseudomonadota bacterium]MCP4920617.1 glycoside hydrolase family 1 protein [Pseudomonadota bacterium]
MLLLTLLSCTKDDGFLAFPADFRFGTATAGFQVEAGCDGCDDPNSDWYQWVTDPDIVSDGTTFNSGDSLDLGPAHYDLYEEDFARAAEMGDLFRFSFEWSRLFPDGEAEQATSVEELAQYVDADGLAYYHDYLAAMKGAGIEPVATVNHYTLPLWVHDGKECREGDGVCVASGWLDEDRIIPLITLFSQYLAREFGGDISMWLTLNEPLAVIVSGYLFPSADRTNPPGLQKPELAMDVAWNMARAHAQMAEAIRAEDADAEVGIVVNLGVAYPESQEVDDIRAAEHLDYVYNEAILEMFLNGNFDSDLDGIVDETDPSVAGKTDWLGLNYYFAFEVAGFPRPIFSDYEYLDFFPKTLDSDVVYLGQAIDMTAEWGLPIWITENGVANPGPDDGTGYVEPALRTVRAKAEEHDVRGYMFWSLIDNYEWNHGMGMTFGLYEVDVETKERTLRATGETYKQIIADHGFVETPEG